MGKTIRRDSSRTPTVHYPTKRGRKAEVRRTRQEVKRELGAYR